MERLQNDGYLDWIIFKYFDKNGQIYAKIRNAAGF
jgi:hypothetical protein